MSHSSLTQAMIMALTNMSNHYVLQWKSILCNFNWKDNEKKIASNQCSGKGIASCTCFICPC